MAQLRHSPIDPGDTPINPLTEDINNPIIVVAHPDDEVLWFSSVIKHAKSIIVCFGHYELRPELAEGRRRAIEQHPLRDKIIFLDIEEPPGFMQAAWPNPTLTPRGFAITRSRRVARVYDGNFDVLLKALTPHLATATQVITHNHWGEYGHEGHGLVHAAVRALQPQHGFDLLFSNYVSQRNLSLFEQVQPQLDSNCVTLQTEISIAQAAATAYRNNGCWTWYDDYQWPLQEALLRYRPNGQTATRSQCLPINMLHIDIPARHISLARRIVGKIRRTLAAWRRAPSPQTSRG